MRTVFTMKTYSVILAGAVLALAAWAARQRHDVEAETVVDASPERVWEVLTDTAAYAEWNPVIVRLSGELRPGATLEFVNRGQDGREMTFRPRVLKAEAGRELRWLGQVGVPRLFDGEHYFVLTPLPGGRTRLQHGEHFRGVLVPLVRGWLRRTIEPDYAQVNAALGARAELSRRPPPFQLLSPR